MKIAFIGNFRVGFTTENDLAWSLGDLGHEVLPMQEDQWSSDDILKTCLEHHVDLLLYVHTHTWVTPGSITLDELWQTLDEHDIPTVSFHLDYWRGLAREIDVGTHPFWRTKYVFTADGGSNDWYREQGINHFWLPPGVVKKDCYYAEPRDRFQHDVIFVGSRIYHPEWDYRPKLIQFLQDTYGDRFAHYGNDGKEVVRQNTLNELYRSARVVVGDSLCLNFTHPNYWSDRATETMGRGGFLIHPKIEGMDTFFKDKEHLVYYNFGDFEGLKGTIDYYINDYAERERIRLAGHLHTKANHTYTNRMEQMLNTIKEQEK